MTYVHKEAFCLMLYQGQTSKRVLDIWNSRDGITPFMALIDDEEYVHIAFSFDRRVPSHRLKPGDYFWRDITLAEAERIAAFRLDRHEPNLHELERSRQIAELAQEIGRFGDGPAPHLDRAPFITVVDDGRLGLLREFDSLAKEWSAQIDWSAKHTPNSESVHGVTACRNELEDVIAKLRDAG